MILDILTLPFRILWFVLWFLKEIVVSAVSVAVDALTAGQGSTPRVVRMELPGASPARVVMISSLITLTPGTLTLGVVGAKTEHPTILVHCLYDDSAETALEALHDMDQRMMRAVRIGGR